MKKVVFFIDITKLHAALEHFDIQDFIGKKVPVKLHMGEIKNKYFPRPDFVKQVVDELKKVCADPYLFDTTVAYSGLRHSKTGYIDGFSILPLLTFKAMLRISYQASGDRQICPCLM